MGDADFHLIADSASRSDPRFVALAATQVASNWNSHGAREHMGLTIALFRFVTEIQIDTGLLSSSTPLLSQVIGSACPVAIWRSVFEILDLSVPCHTVPVSITAGASLEDFPPPPNVDRAITPGNLSTVRTCGTPIKANTGTFVTQSGIHTELDPRVRADPEGLTFPNTLGFMDAFFQPY